MTRLLLERTGRLVLVGVIVTAVAFTMIRLIPGDPAIAILGANATPERIDSVREELGLNEPVIEQYFEWVAALARGDFGRSYVTNQPVRDSIIERLPVTLELILIAELIAIPVSVVLAVWAAYRRDTWVDKVVLGGSFGLLSIPVFVTGILLIWLFAVQLQVVPAGGFSPPSDGLGKNLLYLLMPAAALAATQIAPYVRVLRAEMVQVLDSDYVSFARAKGLSSGSILLRHALRPSSIPLLTVIGLSIGHLVGGAVIVETIFSLPGIGRLSVTSIASRDYVVVQGVVVLVAIGYVGINFLVDILHGAIDPRVRVRT